MLVLQKDRLACRFIEVEVAEDCVRIEVMAFKSIRHRNLTVVDTARVADRIEQVFESKLVVDSTISLVNQVAKLVDRKTIPIFVVHIDQHLSPVDDPAIAVQLEIAEHRKDIEVALVDVDVILLPPVLNLGVLFNPVVFYRCS